MEGWTIIAIFTTVVLLQFATVAAAHGDEIANKTTAATTVPIDQPHLPADSYMRYPEHISLILTHIALMTIGWVFALPVAVVFSVIRSHLAMAAQIVFLTINGLGVVAGIIYNKSTPDLYEHGKHGTVGYIISLLVALWVLLGFVDRCIRGSLDKRHNEETDISTSSQSGDLVADISSSPDEAYINNSNSNASDDDEKHGFLRSTIVDRFSAGKLARFARTIRAFRLLYLLLERTALVLGFLGITTGAVIYTGIFHGRNIFNGLAHFIKGGIFFWYGFLTFARWMGCFADMGWAWNLKPSRRVVGRAASMPSAEFVESAVICGYGASNVFLEHLSNPGGEWAARDLEHVSITLMFFGGGLLGMIIESTHVRNLLMSNLTITFNESTSPIEASFSHPKQHSVSMNPMPALVIYFLGRLMGAHHQASEASTMIHSQWGNLFSGFALARIATYALLYVQPPVGHLPQRPPTEVLASFCLVAGGMLFMLSNRDTVRGLGWNELDAMAIFNVCVGLTAFLMAWSAVVMALKGWAQRKVAKRRRLSAEIRFGI